MRGFYYPIILRALRTGLRVGELVELRWEDVDFVGGFIEVKRNFYKGRITVTKNHKRRRVDMSPHLMETLKALKLGHKKMPLKKGYQFPELVFANKKGERMREGALRDALNKILDLAGFRRIRIHDLRHTYATIRLMRGHNIKDVSKQLVTFKSVYMVTF